MQWEVEILASLQRRTRLIIFCGYNAKLLQFSLPIECVYGEVCGIWRDIGLEA